jgi:hypothetical protein
VGFVRVLIQLILALWLTVENHDNLFVAAETVHFLGIGVLVYKLTQEKSCAGAPSRGGSQRHPASSQRLPGSS